MRFGKHVVPFILAANFILAGIYGLSRIGLVHWPAHYDPLALPDLNEKLYWLTRAGMNMAPSPPKNAGKRCALDDGVQLSHLAATKIKTEDMRCNIAARLYMWEHNVVQPEALRHFGEPVAEILHFGSYNCRTIRGSTYMSEHSTGNAFDISGFILRSGKTISVLKDWGNGSKSTFLAAVHVGLCDYFNLTLSPDYNAAHKDHFHVDMGWVRGCH
jgi:hypothetical protein